MDLKEALAKVKEKWGELPHEKRGGFDCVWMVGTDHAESYEVDEEWIGMREDGVIVWAYASGCSCWDGEYEVHETHDEKEIKAFEFNHQDMRESWEEKIINFASKL